LSETCEGSLLALPGRTQHGWNPKTRHEMMNRNYVEFALKVAGLPTEDTDVVFYPTREELAWAKNERVKMNAKQVVMWSAAGSSVHKTWAGLDHILASIMPSHPDTHVVLVGGLESTILEQGWEKEARVHKTCGKWSIRQSLAFLSECDVVIGPETGVMN